MTYIVIPWDEATTLVHPADVGEVDLVFALFWSLFGDLGEHFLVLDPSIEAWFKSSTPMSR